MRSALVTLALALLSAVTAPGQGGEPAGGRDWFVRAGATGGDGALERPFADPWQALAVCEAGDRVHVARGVYTGQLGAGSWVVPYERVALYGGYDERFEARDPWAMPTWLAWDPASKNWPKQARLTSQAKDVVVDGFVLDMQDQNAYVDDQRTGRTGKPSETALELSQPATVENCVVLNPGFHGVDVVPGSKVRNNIVLNALDWGVTVTSSTGPFARMTAEIERNTILFAWDLQKPGGGGYGGAAVALRGPARVARNILAWCDNSAVYSVYQPDKIAVTANVFWRNRYANVTAELGADRAVANDADMELLEEFGLAAYEGNLVQDPGLALDAAWLARAAVRDTDLASRPAVEPEPLGWGETRTIEITKGIAPAYGHEHALALLAPTSAGDAGARRVPLAVAYVRGAAASPTPVKVYESKALLDWQAQPAEVDGRALEMVVAIGSVANVSTMPAAYDKSNLAGVFLYDPLGNGTRITGFFAQGTNVARVCDDASGDYQGQGKPEVLHLVRGVAYAVQSVPRAAFHIESIERFEGSLEPPKPRPLGRDWFVRAGASGGDGSRDKPFRDPFQALERCESGDTLHIAEGEYVGKLKAGRWRIDMPYIALLGGYDGAFSVRDPWRHPTRLVCPVDFQGRRGGYTLEGAEDHTGAVLDGLVFDKALNNVYVANGALNVGRSDKTEHVWLSSPECVIRNCVFANGAQGALRVANGQTLENNVLVNHFTQVVAVESGSSTAPIVIRGNTLAFVWDSRPGHGLGATGHLLHLSGRVRAVVERNVLAWADNDAIRLDADAREVALRGNVFAHNLWSNVQRMRDYASFDDQRLAQATDLGFRVFEGNVVADPGLAVDPVWLAHHRALRSAQGEAVTVAPTAPARARNPFDDPDPAPATPPPAPAPTGGGANPFDDAPDAAPIDPTEPPVAALYPWRAALALFAPADSAAPGARVLPLTVELKGIVRSEPQHEYRSVTWADARDATAWGQLDGQRVQLEVAIQRVDNQHLLPGVTAADHLCFLAGGPEGTDSGGLPLRCYVPLGTRHQRAVLQAKGYGPGAPEEVHIVSGIARADRQLVVERVERRP